jgi:hypothetical protein
VLGANMLSYKAPITDINFLIEDVFDYYDHYKKYPEFEDATPDMVDAIFKSVLNFVKMNYSLYTKVVIRKAANGTTVL